MKDISIVDLLSDTMDVDGMELDSIDAMIASGAVHALLRNEVTLGRTSTPKCNQPETSSSREKEAKYGNFWCV